MAGLAAADGGYFASEWGLATLGFVLVAVTAVIVADVPLPSRLGIGFVAGLTALAAWAALSALWSPGATVPVQEGERGLLYAAAAAAGLVLLAAGAPTGGIVGGIVAAAVCVSAYSLATRLFPGHVGGAYDPSSGYQLAEPIGYWNALGILVALAVLLALGLAAHGRLPARAAAALALVVLLPTLYFTFSRGAILALAAGGVVQGALDPRRARLIVSAGVLGAPAALGVLAASRHGALTAPGATLATAQAEGRDLAGELGVLALVALALAFVLSAAERRIRVPPRVERGFVVAVAAVVVVAAVGAALVLGGRAADAFSEELRPGSGDLDRRLLSASGNGRSDYWRIALRQAADAPLVGGGAGSYEAAWLRERPVAFHARDAHNLYLETAAELGLVGLALLLATLALPLVALLRARRRHLGAAAGAAYAAFLLHAAVDWDWELPAVTIPALLCGCVLLARAGPAGPVHRLGVVALALPVLAVALVAHAGNRAAAASADAASAGDPQRALAEARKARAWAPWSEEAWVLRAEAELLAGDDAAARRSAERAVDENPESWRAWYVLAVATDGSDDTVSERALEEVLRLNPRSPEAEEIRTER